MVFFDANTGILSNNAPALFRTTNGGNNWVVISTSFYNAIQKIDSVCAYARGGNTNSEKIYRTFNKGLTWDSVSESSNNAYTSISFINRDTGWISGFDGNNNLIWKTTNGGVTLVPVTYSIGIGTLYMYREKVNGNYIGWHSNGVGTRKTTDGGVNWFIITYSIGIGCTYFLNKDTGWTTCATCIYKTYDGGYNWTLQPMPSDPSFVSNGISSFSVTSKDILYGIGGEKYLGGGRAIGLIWKTTNGGERWGYQQPDTSTHFGGSRKTIYFIDSLIGWAFETGPNGIHTTNGGGPIIYTKINNNSQTLTKNFELYQNYPNPFNSVSSIKYQVSRGAEIRIIVFDISGREITTPMNEKKTPGNYEVRFNGEDLSSGIYYYSLYADGERVGTKRMVLIK